MFIKAVESLKEIRIILVEFVKFASEYITCEKCLFDIKVIACELLSNAVKFDGRANFTAYVDGEYIYINITCSKIFKLNKNLEMPSCYCESGRGLLLVKELSNDNLQISDGLIRVKFLIKDEK